MDLSIVDDVSGNAVSVVYGLVWVFCSKGQALIHEVAMIFGAHCVAKMAGFMNK